MSKPISTAPPDYLLEKSRIIDRRINDYLPRDDQYPEVLHRAIRYSVLSGGKRLRPTLALAAFEGCNGTGDIIYPAAVALEFIHCYSLIHDDLPCMDDDDIRRGQPTVHKKFGEAVALLAGDALHDLAFGLMADTGRPEIIRELTDAIGTGGMLAGQMADMESEGRQANLDEITYIHTHKTGKLIRASVRVGALLADAERDYLDAISCYGEKVGLAFQIMDDILDIEGDPKMTGKPVGSDSKNRKATYPGVAGMDMARVALSKLIDEAIEIITAAVPHSDNFIRIARFIGGRQN
jgi:geranylgeranyl diphosphate synthase type II